MTQGIFHTKNVVSTQLIQLLESLWADERNSIYIVSGKLKYLIDKWFGSVPRLGLAAEYGFQYRFNNESEWKSVELCESKDWMIKAKKLFQWYKARTDGSEIEVKGGSLAWVYKDCDPELGNWQAQELEKSLRPLLSDYPDITITHDKGFVEVKYKGLEKGECARLLINECKRKNDIDFLLCMGEAISNEHMFKTVSEIYSQEANKYSGRIQGKNCKIFTCTVGRKPSYAGYYVNDYKDALMLLKTMALCSIKISKNKSVDDLIGFEIKKIGNRSPSLDNG